MQSKMWSSLGDKGDVSLGGRSQCTKTRKGRRIWEMSMTMVVGGCLVVEVLVS